MARKLKKFVIPTLVGTVGSLSLIGIPLYLQSVKPVDSKYKYTIKKYNEDVQQVINEVVVTKPMRPFLEETVAKVKDFYGRNDEENVQQNSLIYYDKTYIPSTGIVYSCEEPFEVVSSMDGVVKKVSEDNLLGKYVEIEHKDGYKTVYYSLSETTVTEGTNVMKGDVIGSSGVSKVNELNKNNVLFEVYRGGYLIDPEEFYNIEF